MPDLIPASDNALRAFLIQFVTGANQYSLDLGLSAGELADISAAADGFGADLDASNNAKAQAKAAVQTKDEARQSASDLVRTLNKRFRTRSQVTPAMYEALGLPVYAPPTAQTPKTPTDLLVKPTNTGDVIFRYGRNGNTTRAVFVIEQAPAPEGPWTFVGGSMRVRVKFSGFPVGVRRWFRVYTMLDQERSQPTVPVALYPDGGETALKVAA